MSAEEIEKLRKEYEFYSKLVKQRKCDLLVTNSCSKPSYVNVPYPKEAMQNKRQSILDAKRPQIKTHTTFNISHVQYKTGSQKFYNYKASYYPTPKNNLYHESLPFKRSCVFAHKQSHPNNYQLQVNYSLSKSYSLKTPKSWPYKKPQKGFVGKYALKRSPGDSSNREISINKILGRKINNLSRNKYRFVNANTTSYVTPKKHRLSYKFFMKRQQLGFQVQSSPLSVKKYIASRLVGRSCKLLSAKKSNKHCRFFINFGKCHKGVGCRDIHDPDKISICTRFLRGTCNVSNCLFSHKISKDKMPTCTYFLKGRCIREDCPYNHVNVGRDAQVCKDFINGHCSLGKECKKKHVYLCPEFSKTGSCSLSDSCPMRHVFKKRSRRSSSCKMVPVKICSGQDVGTKNEKISMSCQSSKGEEKNSNSSKENFLPTFISLNASSNSWSDSSFVCDGSYMFSDSENLSILPRLH